MVGFKKREIVYRPFETVFKIITDIVMIICFTYLIVIAFFDKITITGHSMNNTLQNNQTVLLNTIAYSVKAPERYDLIAFKTGKKDNTSIYVRRVIGLPGETVQIQDGKIYIDGKELTEDICNEEIYNAGFAAEPVKLGYDEFFVLGDNRNNSDDSRYSNIGTVKRDMIIGKPWLRIKPASDLGKIKYKTEKNGSDSNGGE